MNDKLKMIVVSGPTAIGKTSLSIQFAAALEAEIISADSRQLYREMDIGTAKPSPEELEAVPHHFINYKSIHEYYSAGRFEMDVLGFLEHYTKDIVLMTGGSGLYIRAVCEGIDEMPDPDLNIRENLQKRLENKGLEHLVEELKKMDEEAWEIIDLRNPKRVVRALEVIQQTGRKFSDFRKYLAKERPFDILKIGLDLPREVLFDRIEERVDKMLDSGLLDEVKSLFPYRHLTALQTVGYTEFFDYLQGRHDLDEAIRLCKRNTRHYAKRQMTWFKKDAGIEWFSPEDFAAISARIDTFLSN